MVSSSFFFVLLRSSLPPPGLFRGILLAWRRQPFRPLETILHSVNTIDPSSPNDPSPPYADEKSSPPSSNNGSNTPVPTLQIRRISIADTCRSREGIKRKKSSIRNWAYFHRNVRRGKSEIWAYISFNPASIFTENEALILLFKRPKSDAIPSKSPPQHLRRNPRSPPKIVVDLSPEVFFLQAILSRYFPRLELSLSPDIHRRHFLWKKQKSHLFGKKKTIKKGI